MRCCATTLAAAATATLALSCLPTIPPDWLVDHPIVLGIQPVVIATGSHAAPLTDDPPGATRAEVLPGDRVRLSALVVDRAGPIDLEPLDPIWLRCADNCGYSVFIAAGDLGRIVECDDPEWQLAPLCRIGVGAAVERRIPGGYASGEEYMLISGTPGGATSEACLVALLENALEPADDLFDCLYVERRVSLGPIRRLAEIYAEDGFDPANYAEADPNLNPGIDGFHLAITGAAGRRELEVVDGDVVEVAVGERVVVTLLPAADAIQEYAAESSPTSLEPEVLAASWFLSAHLADVDEERRELTHTFRVPAGIESFDEYAVLRDGRASLSWARLRWRVDGAGAGS